MRRFQGGSIFELEFLGLSSPKDRFQWYLVLDGTRYTLSFIDMVGSARHLSFGGMLTKLDLEHNTLEFGNSIYLVRD